MKAIVWAGPNKVACEEVPDPSIESPRDVILKVTATTICGSDLHLYDGYIPAMERGDVLGHEFVGEVVAMGSEAARSFSEGDRVCVSPMIACGNCYFCGEGLYSLCDNGNPDAALPEKLWGHSPCGIFGYSHMLGGYAGSQAEYIRVPFADVGAARIPDGIPDDKALFCSDAFATGYFAADIAGVKPGDVVAVWGAGAVGLFAAISARLLGAERVISIDRFANRLALASARAEAETIDYSGTDVIEELKQMTGGRGPDVCIDAVGMEAHKEGPEGIYDRAKQALKLETERPYVMREAIMACRKGGTISMAGVYGALVDKFPLGALMNKGLQLRTGQVHAQGYIPRLLGYVEQGEVDPSFVATHTLGLDDAQDAYQAFKHKTDDCVRVLFRPGR
jgi:threonine dehydrogenase-like Zn-dependent dehydrogenase